jgi:hypothetical protein
MGTPPLDQVNAMSRRDYFTLAAKLTKLHRPHVTDWSLVKRMKVSARSSAKLSAPTTFHLMSSKPLTAPRLKPRPPSSPVAALTDARARDAGVPHPSLCAERNYGALVVLTILTWSVA